MIVVGEDHNVLCDQRLTAASRVRWLAVGHYLRERGSIAEAGDLFYYTPGELFEALEDGDALAPATIAERHQLQAAYRAAIPPTQLGSGHRLAVPARPAGVVRGIPASPGRHQGTARVARTLHDASYLDPGDVLVCVMTAPAWTPLLGIAGAVVTDAGGALSHAAIVAREFGIPAVVGTATATQHIPDGATVLVDGAAGTVEVITRAGNG
jgi:pyruvate,water dikinase